MSSQQTYFNSDWLKCPEFHGWIQEVKGNPKLAYCSKCHKTITLSNMGKSAIKSHMKKKNHLPSGIQNVASIKKFLKSEHSVVEGECSGPKKESQNSIAFKINNFNEPSPSDCESNLDVASAETLEAGESMSIPPPPDQQHIPRDTKSNLDKFVLKKTTQKAEILWALDSVLKHRSFRSQDGTPELFKVMFPDSNIAMNYSCQKDKMSYLCTFGIAPVFRETLIDTVKGKACFSILFDECFNEALQEDQMDTIVRFWQADKVVFRYLGSTFLNSTKAVDLVENLKCHLAKLDQAKLVQIEMDGPNVNYKTYDLFEKDRRKQDPQMPELLNIDTCTLHIVHGGIQYSMKMTGWDIEKLLNNLFWLFRNTYKRRSEYTQITKSSTFPLKFCATRWVEDKQVAKRALEIWPNVSKYVKETWTKKKSEIPTCASFATVKEAVLDDPFVPAKLEFFIFVTSIVKPFLTKNQGDQPMRVFMVADLTMLLSELMALFVKPETLKSNATVYKLANIDVSDKSTLLSARKVNIGNGAKTAVAAIGNAASALQKLDFQEKCLKMLCAFVGKIQERCPLKFSFVRSLTSLNPKIISLQPEEAKEQFGKLVRKLISTKWKTTEEGDAAERQYRRIIQECEADLKNFDVEKERLDTFYYKLLEGKGDFKDLWSIVQISLVLSHGQASIERGFSINDDFLNHQLKKETLVALRIIYDTVKSMNIKVHEIEVSEKLLKSCSQSRQKYDQYLDEAKAEKKREDRKRKFEEVEEGYKKELKKLKSLEEQVESCILEADKKAKEALKKENFSFLTMSVALRDKATALRTNDIEKQKKVVQEWKSKLAQT